MFCCCSAVKVGTGGAVGTVTPAVPVPTVTGETIGCVISMPLVPAVPSTSGIEGWTVIPVVSTPVVTGLPPVCVRSSVCVGPPRVGPVGGTVTPEVDPAPTPITGETLGCVMSMLLGEPPRVGPVGALKPVVTPGVDPAPTPVTVLPPVCVRFIDCGAVACLNEASASGLFVSSSVANIFSASWRTSAGRVAKSF